DVVSAASKIEASHGRYFGEFFAASYLAFHDKLALDGIIAQTIEEALAVEVRQAERERVTAAVATNAVDLGT
ncbi:hypothetical protein, partial [Klebsiella pneumoniae]